MNKFISYSKYSSNIIAVCITLYMKLTAKAPQHLTERNAKPDQNISLSPEDCDFLKFIGDVDNTCLKEIAYKIDTNICMQLLIKQLCRNLIN